MSATTRPESDRPAPVRDRTAPDELTATRRSAAARSATTRTRRTADRPPHAGGAAAAPAFDRATIQRPLTVGVIGAGRVGAVLGAALSQAGHQVLAVSGRSGVSRARIARMLPGATPAAPEAVARAARLIIIAVPDDRLEPLVNRLAAAGALSRGQIVAHTSGANGIGVLAAAAACGAVPLALHPAMTFTGSAADLSRLPGTSFGVTVAEGWRPLADKLVRDLGGVPEWVPEHRRVLYHAALAHGANHLVTLVNEAMDRLRDAGVAQPERVIGPLLHAALDNTLLLGDAALTGPVSRGDAGTVAKHLDILDEVAAESVPSYLALARRTADRAIAAGRLSAAAAEPLLGVLARRAGEDPA